MVVGAAAAGVGLGLVVLVAGVWALWPRPHKRLEQAALPAVALLPAAPATHRPVAAAPTPTLSQAPAPAKPAPPTTAAKRTEPPPAAQVPEPDYEVRQEGKLAPSAPAAPPPKPTEEPEEDADESLPGMEKGSQLEKLVNAMTNPAVVLRDRVRCAEAIGKLGPKGKPATRALCRAMLKSPPLLRVAATNALEKVYPELHPHVTALLVDNDTLKHLKAVQRIRKMKKSGSVVTPILLYRLGRSLGLLQHIGAQEFQTQVNIIRRKMRVIDKLFDSRVGPGEFGLTVALDRFLTEADEARLDALGGLKDAVIALVFLEVRTLGEVAGGEEKVARTVAELYASPYAEFRLVALHVLTDIALDHPASRKELFACINLGLANGDENMRVACITEVGRLGKDARSFVPILTKMKALDGSEAVRNAAGVTLELIGSQQE